MSTISEQAQLAAARVDTASVSLPAVVILETLIEVLPRIAACWKRNDEPNPQLARMNLERYHKSQPEACRRRTARRIRAEAETPMSRHDSFMLADAVIQQALSADENTVAYCCVEAGL